MPSRRRGSVSNLAVLAAVTTALCFFVVDMVRIANGQGGLIRSALADPAKPAEPVEKVRFYLGQKVEVVRGFYRHRSGQVVGFKDYSGKFLVKLDERPQLADWWVHQEIDCDASELAAVPLTPRPTPAGCRVTIGGGLRVLPNYSRPSEPRVICPHGKLVPRSWLYRGHTHSP